MRILVIAFYEVYPPASGAAVVSYNCARFLSGERFLLQLCRSTCETPPDGRIKVINLRIPQDRNVKKVVSLAWRLPGIAAAIKGILPDYVIFEGASWTLYYLFLLYLIRAARLKSKIVYHAHNVEYVLRKQKNHVLIAELTKWGERRLLKSADLITAVSEIDAECFERLYGVRPILFPNGVDLERFRAVTPSGIEAIRQKYHLAGKIVLFMGLTAFPPNQEAIDFLTGHVFPKLTARLPNANLAIIGGPVRIKRDWLVAPGSIPYQEIPSFIAASDVCVAPIFSGSGTRLKILEYMAAAKPVVSTPKGAEGIHVEAGQDILVANEQDFSEAIERVLQDSGLAQKLGLAGYRVVEKEYSWAQILTNFQAHLTPGLGMKR